MNIVAAGVKTLILLTFIKAVFLIPDCQTPWEIFLVFLFTQQQQYAS